MDPIPIHVLHIEDDPVSAALLPALLAESRQARFEVERVDRLAPGLERLNAGGVDVVLLDLSLPDSQGMDTFLRTHAHAPDVPIIVLTGQDDEGLAMETLKHGAQDFLDKASVNGHLLVRALRYALERKQSAATLAHERHLLHALLDSIPDRIYFKDAASRYLRVNRAMARLFGLDDPAEAVGRTDFDYFTIAHAEAAYADEQDILRTREPLIGRIEQETLANGTTHWLLTTKMPLRARDGRVTGTFGVSRDITALKGMETSLAEERNLLRSLIDHLPDEIYFKDAEGRYVIHNRAHNQRLGDLPPEQVIGKTAFELFPPGQAAARHLDDLTAIRSGQPSLNREEPLHDAADRVRWRLSTKVPLHTPSGDPAGLVCISRDITERREAEERVRAANTELQEANAALKSANLQLIHAEQMQSVGRLAAGVAHEVKNPLAILRMGVDFFAESTPAAESTAALGIGDMRTAIARANSIIMGLLDFARPHSLELQPADVNALAIESLKLLRHELASHRHTVKCELEPGQLRANLDPQKLEQVLVNLLTNALHAMPDGGTLTMRTHARALLPEEVTRDPGARDRAGFHAGETIVCLEVDDTGGGIPEDHLAKIYDPFFTTKETGKGTGLGLTVVRKIVELHGGILDIRNRPEGGVRATLIFRAIQEET